MYKPLSGKVALVTGGAKRIGRAVALALAEAGTDVAITYRESEADAQEAVALLSGYGVQASCHACDLADSEAIVRTVAEVHERYGRLDLLVNNAGRFESVALDQITAAQWDLMFAVNSRAPFLMSQACFPHLKANGGRIVNVGSLGGLKPWATHGHYCASKAALHMLTEVMAKAWAPEVAVNCVAPGMIEMAGESFDSFIAKTPMHRNGTAEDIASAVLYFATSAGFITGQVLAVDGGLGL